MARDNYQLNAEISELRRQGFGIEHGPNFKWIHIAGLDLPERGIWTTANNQRITYISVLIDIPPDWPIHPPGVGFSHPSFAIHMPSLFYNGERLHHLFECNHSPWNWACFQRMDWKPEFGLRGLLQIIEQSIWERTK